MKNLALETNLDEWIAASLNGNLSDGEQRALDDYLAAHPEARRAYEETLAMSRLLEKTLKEDEPDPGFEDRMVRRFRNKKQARDYGFWKLWSGLWQGQKTAYAGALAALVLSLYVGGRLEENQPVSEADTAFENRKQQMILGGVNTYAGGADITKGTLELESAQEEVRDYFNYPSPVDYDAPRSAGSGSPALANLAAAEVFKESDFRGRENGRGDFNLNAMKVALEKPLSDEGKLRSDFRTDVMMGEDQAALNYQNLFDSQTPLWHTGVLGTYKIKEQADQKFGVTNGAAAPANMGGSIEYGSKVKTGEVPALGDVPVVGRFFKEGKEKAAKEGNVGAPPPPDAPKPSSRPRQNGADKANAGQQQQELQKQLERVQDEQKAIPADQKNVPAVESPSPAEIQRKLIRNANIGLEVKSYAAAVRDLARLAQDEKGFVATQNDRTQANGHTAGQIVIKLPPDRLDGFVLRLREFGNIRHQTLKTDDVTKAYFDTEARLRNARKTEDRLLELMAKKTDKVADLLQVEKEIARVRESIEQMQGELKLWDSLSSLATVTLDLVEQDMDLAAAYLLKERANLSVYSADVEKSYKEARDWAEKSEAQIVTAQVNRNEGGRMSATLSLLAAPEKAFLLIEQLKGLGRVQSFDQDTERVAQDGHSGIAGTTKRDKVEIQVSIVHDDASRKTVNLQIVTPEVEKALDQCKKAALAASGEVLTSSLQRNTSGHSQAVLTVRLPAKRVEEAKAVFASQGRVVRLAVQREDDTGTNIENEDMAPVILSLTLSDEEPPVQITRLDVEGEKVAAKVEELKARAKALGIEIRASSFSRNPNGVEQANLVFRMTQKEYVGMLESLLGTGKTLNLTLERRDRLDTENSDPGNEPVEVLFRLKSPSPLVANENGFMGAMRQTLGKSFGMLSRSLERIVTGFAWLLPWLLTGGVIVLVWKRVKRSRKG